MYDHYDIKLNFRRSALVETLGSVTVSSGGCVTS